MIYVLLGVAVCGWAVALGLYLQLKDALALARSWREIATEAFGDLVRERHVAEFAVKQLEAPLPVFGDWDKADVVRSGETYRIHSVQEID